MIGSALEDVRKAEAEADRIVEDARKKAAAIVSGAKEKAAHLLRQRKEETGQKKAQLEARRKEKADAAREKVLAEGSAEIKSLRKLSEKKTDDAVELVLEAFEREASGL